MTATDAPRDGAVSLGIFRVGELVVAVPSLRIREVVMRPKSFSPLPSGSPYTIGVMILRDDTVPVIDLHQMLDGAPTPKGETDIIIILRCNGRLLGLLATEIRGLLSVNFSDRRTIQLPSGLQRDVIRHDGEIISILSVEDLFAQGVDTAQETLRTTDAITATDEVSYLLCGISGHNFAVETLLIDATLPRTELKNSPLVVGMCDGVITHHGRDIPVLDTLQALGLGTNPTRPPVSGSIVVRMNGSGLIGFEVDRFHDICRLRESDFQRRPQITTTRPDLLPRAYVTRDGKWFQVVDSKAVQADKGFHQFARATATEQAEPESTDGTRGPEETYLVFKAGGRFACDIRKVFEIIRLPSDQITAPARGDGYSGTITHRRQVVPLLCLAQIFGQSGTYDKDQSGILLVDRAGQLFGFKVESLIEVTRGRVVKSKSKTGLQIMQNSKTSDLTSLADFDSILEKVEPSATPDKPIIVPERPKMTDNGPTRGDKTSHPSTPPETEPLSDAALNSTPSGKTTTEQVPHAG
ncbi:MAG: chemotaxis protein CheW [Pseudomonadota bacterium]|nr:chemotaxis protein CheW [Pseudomonadota bacterium]